MIEIVRDLTHIIKECKLFLLHVLSAIKFINIHSLIWLTPAAQCFSCTSLSVPPARFPCFWGGQPRPGCCLERGNLSCSDIWSPAFSFPFEMRLQCVNTILCFVAIPGLWDWSLHDSGVLITDSWRCQADVMNNKLPLWTIRSDFLACFSKERWDFYLTSGRKLCIWLYIQCWD